MKGRASVKARSLSPNLSLSDLKGSLHELKLSLSFLSLSPTQCLILVDYLCFGLINKIYKRDLLNERSTDKISVITKFGSRPTEAHSIVMFK